MIRSTKTNEILGTPPNFLIRSGISLITLMLLLFFSVSFIISYPDYINSEIIITGGKPPVDVIASKSGVIDSIYVQEGEIVEEGQVLAIMENPAEYTDICTLKQFLTTVKGMLYSQNLDAINVDNKLKLGELTPYYKKLVNYIVEYNKYLRINAVGQVKERTESTIMQNIKQSLFHLEEELIRWEKQYVLKAKTSGAVSFYKLWAAKQTVSEGDVLYLIIPEASHFFGYTYISVTSSNKLKVGQQVNIKLDSYPYEEFGMVKGEVHSISRFAKDSRYIVKIELPDGLSTTYNKYLDFIPEMKGEAQILIEDLRLIDRIFGRLKNRFQ